MVDIWVFLIYLYYCRIKEKEYSVKHLQYPIHIVIDEDGYFIVDCPAFKGCRSYGETINEALENIKEVIDMCLEE